MEKQTPIIIEKRSQCKWKGTDHRAILYRTLFAHFGKQKSTGNPSFLVKGTEDYEKFLKISEVLTPLFGGDPYRKDGKGGESELEAGPLEQQVRFALAPLPREITSIDPSVAVSWLPNKLAAYEAGLISGDDMMNLMKGEVDE